MFIPHDNEHAVGQRHPAPVIFHRFLIVTLTLLFILLVHVRVSDTAMADGGWKLGKNGDGITVSHRIVSGSSFRETEAEMVIRESLSSIVSFLSDIDAYRSWYPNTRRISVIRRPSEREIIVHQVIHFPAPCRDRDVIMLSSLTQDPADRAVTITMTGLPDYLPPLKNTIRITKCTGSWRLVPMTNGDVRVRYRMHGEPGGALPAWIANAAVTKRPYEIMSRLRDGVKSDSYRNARLSLIAEP